MYLACLRNSEKAGVGRAEWRTEEQWDRRTERKGEYVVYTPLGIARTFYYSG